MRGDTAKGKLNSSIKRIGRTDLKLSQSGFYLRPKYIIRRMGDCIQDPGIFVQYVKYGFKLVINLFK